MFLKQQHHIAVISSDYAKAKDAADRSDKMALASEFDEAIKICKEAMQYCPEHKNWQ